MFSFHIRFSIVNLTKPDTLYREGMQPVMYSKKEAVESNVGWRRCGGNIAYFRNDDNNVYSTAKPETISMDDDEDDILGNICSYTLTFEVTFAHEDDSVYFAHSYPYTYSDLQDYLMDIQKDPFKSEYCQLKVLCRSLAGNNIFLLTVTAPVTIEEEVLQVIVFECCSKLNLSFQLISEQESDCHHRSSPSRRVTRIMDDERFY